jgi:hypothetical protein
MDIVKTKGLENKVNEVEVLGVRSTFHGNIAGVISVSNRKESNVVITSNLEGIKAEDYVFPMMVDYAKANKLYETLK